MQIEVNKKYVLRNGNKLKITDLRTTPTKWPFISSAGVTYSKSGRAGEYPEIDSEFDIIAEATEAVNAYLAEDKPALTGIKHDDSKNRLDLLSTIWLNGVGKVLTFGAKKYAAHNWRGGLTHSRTLGAALRHIFSFLSGEDKDPETGLSHLYHASCCLMFASELHETKQQLVDDRYKTSVTDAESGATNGL